jgi:hypothetical protein
MSGWNETSMTDKMNLGGMTFASNVSCAFSGETQIDVVSEQL